MFQAPRDIYPSITLVETALECGISRLMTGSDAHAPEFTGRGFDQLSGLV